MSLSTGKKSWNTTKVCLYVLKTGRKQGKEHLIMNVLQTIDLKKYYGAKPNIPCTLITKSTIILTDHIVQIEDGEITGIKEVADHDMAF